MKSAIEKILAAHQLLEDFNSNEDYCVKITNEPYMALNIEKHGSQVVVAHYFEQNGDLIADPDMEFEVINSEWSPVALQLALGSYHRAVEYRDGHRFVSQSQSREQRQFAHMWARNLIAQKFTNGKVIRAQVC